MLAEPIRHRRVRRTDFAAVMGVLGASGLPVPPPDRALLRRFRRLASDLGSDFYVALVGERVVGFVHLTYARQLTQAMKGRVEALVVAPEARRDGVGTSLATLARRRARRRGCSDLRCTADLQAEGIRPFLTRNGWRAEGDEFRVDLGDTAQ
jgi:GNAT superfamily N-acetyltransferase